MSRFLHGPGVVLGAADCARIDPLLMRSLVDAQRRDAVVPAEVREIAADVHSAALWFRAEMLIKPGSGTHELILDAEMPAWEPEERLSTAQAARIAEVSTSYISRLIGRGELDAVRVRGGGWAVNGASLALWMAGRRRREGHDDDSGTERRR